MGAADTPQSLTGRVNATFRRRLLIFCSMRRIRRESRAAANEARHTTSTIRTASSSRDEETERARNSNASITFDTLYSLIFDCIDLSA
jgi:hypothetical protein